MVTYAFISYKKYPLNVKKFGKNCSEGKVDIIYKSCPIQTPRTDCSEFSNIVAILATFCYLTLKISMNVNPSLLSSKISEN